MTSGVRRRAAMAAGMAVGCALASAAAHTEEFVTRYTSTAPKSCKAVKASRAGEGQWTIWSCPGIAGLIVHVTEDDLRMSVSVGRSVEAAGKEPAATQGFRPFNQVNDTLEWRSAKGAPFAIIQRWTLSDSENVDRSGRPPPVGLLVVTKLPPGPVCHVAYIDVQANPEPNLLARRAADETARTFDCNGKPSVVGQRARAIELAER